MPQSMQVGVMAMGFSLSYRSWASYVLPGKESASSMPWPLTALHMESYLGDESLHNHASNYISTVKKMRSHNLHILEQYTGGRGRDVVPY